MHVQLRLVAAIVLAASLAGSAQTAAPELPDAARLSLHVLDLTAENLQLRIALVNAEREQLLATLQRDGYTLQRSASGWSYVEAAK